MREEQIKAIAQDMLSKYAHEARKALIRVGEAAIEGERDNASILAYHEAQAKVFVLDELLEKIANSSDETDKPKYNLLCNDVIRDSQGNEIARARGLNA